MTLRSALGLALFTGLFLTGCCNSHRATTRPSDDAISDYVVGPEDYQKAVYTQASTRTSATPHRILVLSGGGSNGAWGAGFLKGWGETGQRPVFDIVTGVSTGALMSTAAFLGDDELLEQYKHISNKDIQSPHNKLFAILFSNALNGTKPLKATLKKFVTNEKIDRIADAGNRKLFVASVNLDSGKLVIWDLTAIAKAAKAETHEPEKSQKYDFFREVMRASAAAPALYPPVNLNGSLHCDGGIRASLFIEKYFVPAIKGSSTGAAQGDLYAINNGKIGMADQVTEDCIIPIGERAVACLLNQNGVDSILKARLAAHDAKYNFHLSYIPDDVAEMPAFQFDPKEMSRLFEAGVARGKQDPGRWADEDINLKLQRMYEQTNKMSK